jgi:hypothetical protein
VLQSNTQAVESKGITAAFGFCQAGAAVSPLYFFLPLCSTRLIFSFRHFFDAAHVIKICAYMLQLAKRAVQNLN